MNLGKKAAVAIGVAAIAALALAACSGGGGGTSGGSASFNQAVNGTANPSTTTGGTLKLLASTDCDSWDPARTYYGWCWNMQRVFTRSLVGYSTVNGDKPELAPDLATSLGKHNADFTEWTYTLKKGLKWEDGKAITPMDVKYGVERMFATDVINGGPTSYFLATIEHPADYAGPYKSGDLDTITATDDSVTFKLSSAYGDFDYLMAMAAASPVPYKTEGGRGFVGATYTKNPMASGPYKIESYTENKSITFVRNKEWSQSTDTIRKPLVDKITLTIDSDPNDIDQKLIAGTYDAKADTDVGTNLQAKILTNPTFKKNADNPTAAFTRYFAVIPSVIPNVDCRLAIFYATDKASLVSAFGGSSKGVAAPTMTPPTVQGHSDTANPYPIGKDNSGDLTKAKEELQKCGSPDGFDVKIAYPTPSETGPKVFQAMQTALARVGITATPITSAAADYYSSFIGSPDNLKNQGIGIALASWGADFPTGYGFWSSIADGTNILQNGNINYPSLNDPIVNGILTDATNGKATDADFAKLEDRVMKHAVYLPILWGKSLYYRNPRLTEVRSDNVLAVGVYDWVNVGTGGK